MKLFLDTGVLGMVTHPKAEDGHKATTWLRQQVAGGATIVVPQICDYELRREYMRNNSTKALARLDELITASEYASASDSIWREAARLWAHCRNQGSALASDHALDGDVILIATVKGLDDQVTPCVVATTNVKHLTHFVDARLFEEI